MWPFPLGRLQPSSKLVLQLSHHRTLGLLSKVKPAPSIAPHPRSRTSSLHPLLRTSSVPCVSLIWISIRLEQPTKLGGPAPLVAPLVSPLVAAALSYRQSSAPQNLNILHASSNHQARRISSVPYGSSRWSLNLVGFRNLGNLIDCLFCNGSPPLPPPLGF